MTGFEHPVALLRLREHLSIEELAEQSGVPTPTLLAIENGDVRVSRVIAEALAGPLGVFASELVAVSMRFEERVA